MSDFSYPVESYDSHTEPYLAQVHDFHRAAAEQGRRDEESRRVHRPPELMLRASARSETCQRCGRDLSRVYIWNNRRLCRRCMGVGQDGWDIVKGESKGADTKVLARTAETGLKPFIARLLGFLGAKKDIVEPLFVWPGILEAKAKKRMPVKAVKDKENMPRSEGLMKRKKQM